jgi:hypothetical protein
MKRSSAALIALAPVAWLVALPSPGALTGWIGLERPLRAQVSDDWSTAPIAIPSAPSGGEILPADPAGQASPPPRREIQLPPPELRRTQDPFLPGAAPTIRIAPGRIAPGEGLRPLPASPRPSAAPAPSPSRPAPIPSRPVASPQRVVVPTPLPVTPPLPRAADAPPQVTPSAPGSPSTRFPSVLESLPPGTIRPLPGETLPSSPAPPPPTASPSSLQGAPPQPGSPQSVPPPPWADPAAPRGGRQVPWSWLLLGLGTGAIGMFLAQGRSKRGRPAAPLESLGIRIVAQPDPGRQTLQPQQASAPLPTGRQE